MDGHEVDVIERHAIASVTVEAPPTVLCVTNDATPIVLFSVPSVPLEPGDILKHYQEGRSDVRSYAGFLIQVITLLLSTMIIVIGWIAKDYAAAKYQVALRATAPALADGASLSPGTQPLSQLSRAAAEQAIVNIERDLEYVSAVYRHILYYSPTTSLILGVASFFTLVILGTLIVLTYQMQRRRYHYHAVGSSLGLELDEPVVDPVLTRGALNIFIGIIGGVALVLAVLTVWQSCAYFNYTKSVELRFGVMCVVALVLAKTVSVVILIENYRRFEKKAGWKARWRRARVLVTEIRNAAAGHSDCDETMREVLSALQAVCDADGKDPWRDAEAILDKLLRGMKDTTLGAKLKEQLHELAVTLRHRHWIRRIRR